MKNQAVETPDALAVRGPDGSLTYGELDSLANRIARGLEACGVGKGQRVAIWLDKSTVAVASMQAVMRLGAAYVPIDPFSPPARTRHLLSDCAVTALISTRERAAVVLEGALQSLSCLCVDGGWNGPDWQKPVEGGIDRGARDGCLCCGAEFQRRAANLFASVEQAGRCSEVGRQQQHLYYLVVAEHSAYRGAASPRARRTPPPPAQ